MFSKIAKKLRRSSRKTHIAPTATATTIKQELNDIESQIEEIQVERNSISSARSQQQQEINAIQDHLRYVEERLTGDHQLQTMTMDEYREIVNAAPAKEERSNDQVETLEANLCKALHVSGILAKQLYMIKVWNVTEKLRIRKSLLKSRENTTQKRGLLSSTKLTQYQDMEKKYKEIIYCQEQILEKMSAASEVRDCPAEKNHLDTHTLPPKFDDGSDDVDSWNEDDEENHSTSGETGSPHLLPADNGGHSSSMTDSIRKLQKDGVLEKLLEGMLDDSPPDVCAANDSSAHSLELSDFRIVYGAQQEEQELLIKETPGKLISPNCSAFDIDSSLLAIYHIEAGYERRW